LRSHGDRFSQPQKPAFAIHSAIRVESLVAQQKIRLRSGKARFSFRMFGQTNADYFFCFF
jgi:hypothetical protein